ncbi:class I SAM-dependent methyltransferase [Ensifer sp. LC163]|uniref:class I SAM-dependent methyltransferase n=1 Tax=Ensifer sp. LC163 TaxID=1120652 RepID=UPI000813D3C9|nr:class I SAM-dependent methyltransferase [Ensifer sp. LC163]OCP37485.1 methyltransferase [Ensifer sp. LC163]
MSVRDETLNSIGLRMGTDKSSDVHDFLRLYDKRLSHLRDEKFNFFEVGVFKGGSIRTWREYFSKATIVGIDYDAECEKYANERINIRIADQSDIHAAFDIVQEFGKPLVFLDDGSHRWDHQITTLQIFWPLLERGGIYIIEDLDTSFDGHLKEAPFEGYSPISTYDYLSKLGRMLVGDQAVQEEKPYDLFIASQYKNVDSVEFIRRSCIITKKS